MKKYYVKYRLAGSDDDLSCYAAGVDLRDALADAERQLATHGIAFEIVMIGRSDV